MAKVGATTGRTEAAVLSTCADVNVNGTNLTILCQGLAYWLGGPLPISDKGDSGSPVFKIDREADPFTTDVTLLGVLWGGDKSGGVFSFSHLLMVYADLGLMLVCQSGFAC